MMSGLIFLRLMLYPLLAYGFFLLATYAYPSDKRLTDIYQRGLYGSLCAFFFLLGVSGIIRYAQGDQSAVAFYDLTATPLVVMLLIFVGAVIYRRVRSFRVVAHD